MLTKFTFQELVILIFGPYLHILCVQTSWATLPIFIYQEGVHNLSAIGWIFLCFRFADWCSDAVLSVRPGWVIPLHKVSSFFLGFTPPPRLAQICRVKSEGSAEKK